ncbi:flavodoxin family protein [Konateibacter massiliensis]|uniref:flavodoxin family protein n=1 Tax=Konateibacter massiliensis TaxID=2002841 RepID=UPI000C15C182|nr:flavodoxin [Konateibacter massiliensis]
MKAAIVYFSLEGNTKFVAEKISKQTGAEELRLIPKKDYPTGKISKFFWGGKSVTFGEKPKLESYDFKEDEYDVVIIGTPVWASSFTPPIKTFLAEHNLAGKKVALFACQMGNDAEKCFDKLKKEIGDCEILATLALTDPGKNRTNENQLQIDTFCYNILNKINQ